MVVVVQRSGKGKEIEEGGGQAAVRAKSLGFTRSRLVPEVEGKLDGCEANKERGGEKAGQGRSESDAVVPLRSERAFQRIIRIPYSRP